LARLQLGLQTIMRISGYFLFGRLIASSKPRLCHVSSPHWLATLGASECFELIGCHSPKADRPLPLAVETKQFSFQPDYRPSLVAHEWCVYYCTVVCSTSPTARRNGSKGAEREDREIGSIRLSATYHLPFSLCSLQSAFCILQSGQAELVRAQLSCRCHRLGPL